MYSVPVSIKSNPKNLQLGWGSETRKLEGQLEPSPAAFILVSLRCLQLREESRGNQTNFVVARSGCAEAGTTILHALNFVGRGGGYRIYRFCQSTSTFTALNFCTTLQKQVEDATTFPVHVWICCLNRIPAMRCIDRLQQATPTHFTQNDWLARITQPGPPQEYVLQVSKISHFKWHSFEGSPSSSRNRFLTMSHVDG